MPTPLPSPQRDETAAFLAAIGLGRYEESLESEAVDVGTLQEVLRLSGRAEVDGVLKALGMASLGERLRVINALQAQGLSHGAASTACDSPVGETGGWADASAGEIAAANASYAQHALCSPPRLRKEYRPCPAERAFGRVWRDGLCGSSQGRHQPFSAPRMLKLLGIRSTVKRPLLGEGRGPPQRPAPASRLLFTPRGAVEPHTDAPSGQGAATKLARRLQRCRFHCV